MHVHRDFDEMESLCLICLGDLPQVFKLLVLVVNYHCAVLHPSGWVELGRKGYYGHVGMSVSGVLNECCPSKTEL